MELRRRPRRLRANEAIRKMVRENHLSIEDLIYPMFVMPGEKHDYRVMEGMLRLSLKKTRRFFQMKGKRVIRTVITLGLLAAVAAVLLISRQYNPNNPHSAVPREAWLSGAKGHTYAVRNNRQPWKQCYPCHEKQGLGGEGYCQDCHAKSGIPVSLPQPQ